MASIIKFGATANQLLGLAIEAKKNNDVVKQVDFLKRAIEADPHCARAYIYLAEAYIEMNSYADANDTLFVALANSLEAGEQKLIFGHLAINYDELDMRDVAEYYAGEDEDARGMYIDPDKRFAPEFEERVYDGDDEDDYDDFEDFDDEELDEDDENDIQTVRQRNIAELKKANRLMGQRQFDGAIDTLTHIRGDDLTMATASELLLLCLMLKKDNDTAIALGEKMVAENPDSMQAKTILATAYLMKDRKEEADALIDVILQKEYTTTSDIMFVLPSLINSDRHDQVIKYMRRLIKLGERHPDMMLWFAEALFNAGEKDEAIKALRESNILFGRRSNADYYIPLFASGKVSSVEYNNTIPDKERKARERALNNFMDMAHEESARLISEGGSKAQKILDLAEWALLMESNEFQERLVQKLALTDTPECAKLLRDRLLRADLEMEIMIPIVIYFLEKADLGEEPVIKVVAQDIYKEVKINSNLQFHLCPPNLKYAVCHAICSIIYYETRPQKYVDRAFDAIKQIVSGGDKIVDAEKLDEISRFRSVRTLYAAILGKVYEGEVSAADNIKGNNLVAKTYNRYYATLFGEDDGRKE